REAPERDRQLAVAVRLHGGARPGAQLDARGVVDVVVVPAVRRAAVGAVDERRLLARARGEPDVDAVLVELLAGGRRGQAEVAADLRLRPDRLEGALELRLRLGRVVDRHDERLVRAARNGDLVQARELLADADHVRRDRRRGRVRGLRGRRDVRDVVVRAAGL